MHYEYIPTDIKDGETLHTILFVAKGKKFYYTTTDQELHEDAHGTMECVVKFLNDTLDKAYGPLGP